MKKLLNFSIIFLSFCLGEVYSQSTDLNYIRTRIYQAENGSKYIDIFNYYDGIGRLTESVQKGITPTSKDLVTLQEYDNVGRLSKTWLPVVIMANGNYIIPDEIKTPQSIYDLDRKPYSEIIYESSPMNQEIERFSPGQNWHNNNKAILTKYFTNDLSDSLNCIAFVVSGKGADAKLMKQSAYYPTGELIVTRVENEDGHVSFSFSNKSGQVILTRQVNIVNNNQKKMLDTYMVYDQIGNLCYVLPPLAIEKLASATVWNDDSPFIKDYVYVYKYDVQNRCVAKRLPGTDWVYQVFDKKDRIVMTQNGMYRTENNWVYNVYDLLDNVIEQSIISGSLERDSIQKRYDFKNFHNDLPYLGGTRDIHKPFADDAFRVVDVLASTAYGKGRYTWGDVTKEAIAQDQYFLFHEDYWIGQGSMSSQLPDFDYLRDDDTVNPLYFICSDPSNPNDKYYYIPAYLLPYVNVILDNDATGCFEILDYFPGEGVSVDTIEYVKDDRAVYQLLTIPDNYKFNEVNGIVSHEDKNSNHRELKTYEKLLILDNSPDKKYIERYYYYDYEGRLIQMTETNIMGGISRYSYKYDFVGRILKNQEYHKTSGNTVNIVENSFGYDHIGRMISSTVSLNNSVLADIEYTYDELGRLKAKRYKSGSFDLVENMTYNLRGWLTSKSSPVFNMRLSYENASDEHVKRYDGSISEWAWQHGSGEQLMYRFKYDGINQIVGAEPYRKSGNSWIVNANGYTEKEITYDPSGNILSLQRTANGMIVDNLTYSYKGNSLTSLTESIAGTLAGDIYKRGSVATGSYSYDLNGNMITDSRRILSFNYNVLNLLSEVKTTSGALMARYSYLADGTKLRVQGNGGINGFDYLGSLTYCRSSAGLHLELVNFGDGVIRVTGTGSGQRELNYFLTDHLGSVRVIVDGYGMVKERNDYYPFGARHVRGDYPRINNRLLYNGKEEQVTGDLGYLDYGARMYDSGLGRWFGIDPMAENRPWEAPYSALGNNPISRIDPTGMIWDDVKEAEKLKEDINEKIATLNKNITKSQAKLDKGGLSEKQITKLKDKISAASDRISNLNTSKVDIDILGADLNNVYALSPINGGEHHIRQGSDGKIYIETSSTAMSIHEITHVRQSLDGGGLIFSPSGKLLNAGSGLRNISNMEIEAYKMQYSYDKSFPGNLGKKGLQGIDVHSVGGIMNNGRYVYPAIYQYSVDLKKFMQQQQKMFGTP